MNATAQTTIFDQVNRSFGRCCDSTGFFESFYSILIASHPDIPALFADTDFTKQNEVLQVGLRLMLLFDHGSEAAKQAVETIRESHARDQLNIRPELYDYWLDSLMRACAKHDPQFNKELESSWRTLLAASINHIKSGYDEGVGEAECMAFLRKIDPDLASVAKAWRRLPESVRAEVVARAQSA